MKLLSKNPFKKIMEKDNMTYQELDNLLIWVKIENI